jgi:hypothetical protein
MGCWSTSCSRYWVRFRIGVWEPEQSRTTRRELGGTGASSPWVLAIGDLVTSGGLLTGRPAASGCGPWPVVGVQLADQLGVAALGLDHGQPVGQRGPLPRPTLRGAPGVLLDQQPLVAAVLQVLTNPSASGGWAGPSRPGRSPTRPGASPPKMAPKWCCQARTGRPRPAAIAARIRCSELHRFDRPSTYPTSSASSPSGSHREGAGLAGQQRSRPCTMPPRSESAADSRPVVLTSRR